MKLKFDERDLIEIEGDVFQILSIFKKKSCFEYILKPRNQGIIVAEIKSCPNSIMFTIEQSVKCKIESKSINVAGRTLQITGKRENIHFDKTKNILEKDKIYELSDLKTTENTEFNIERIIERKDGSRFFYSTHRIKESDIKKYSSQKEESVFTEDKKFIIKYKETP